MFFEWRGRLINLAQMTSAEVVEHPFYGGGGSKPPLVAIRMSNGDYYELWTNERDETAAIAQAHQIYRDIMARVRGGDERNI